MLEFSEDGGFWVYIKGKNLRILDSKFWSEQESIVIGLYNYRMGANLEWSSFAWRLFTDYDKSFLCI